MFPEGCAPKGWRINEWSDVSKPADPKAQWKVIDGVLHGSDPRGTWLISEKQYGDFELEFEWKPGRRGSSGCGLRFPDAGDPAFDGLELQMCDPRYYGEDAPKIPLSELTGSLYRAIAPSAQARAFVNWWCERVRTGCTHDPLEGTHGDQKWLELAPSICDGVAVLRHPGYNFAYWNAYERPLSCLGGAWTDRKSVV